MLTTFDHDEYLYDAIRAGASGFLLKDVAPPDLSHAVRTVATGDALVAPAITRRLLEEFVERPRPGARAPEALESLTERDSTSCDYSHADSPTPRSQPSSSSERQRSRRTSATSS